IESHGGEHLWQFGGIRHVEWMEVWREDANDGVRPANGWDRTPDNGRIVAELSGPRAVGEHEDVPPAGRILLSAERAAEEHRDAEHLEKIGVNPHSSQQVGPTVANRSHAEVCPQRQMIEQHRAALPILNDGITDRLWA